MKRSCYSRKRYEEKEEGKKVQGNPVGYSKNWLVIWGWLLKVFWSFLNKNSYLYLSCLYSSTLLVLVLSCVKYLVQTGKPLNTSLLQRVTYLKQSNKFIHV